MASASGATSSLWRVHAAQTFPQSSSKMAVPTHPGNWRPNASLALRPSNLPSTSSRVSLRRAGAPFVAAAVEEAAPAVSEEVISTQKIRIKLKSYHVPQLEEAGEMILKVAKDTGAEAMGPVRLPTHFRRFCVLRSPHVDKDSREHFEIRTHKRLIDLTSPTAQTIDALMQIEMPYGVAVDVKLT